MYLIFSHFDNIFSLQAVAEDVINYIVEDGVLHSREDKPDVVWVGGNSNMMVDEAFLFSRIYELVDDELLAIFWITGLTIVIFKVFFQVNATDFLIKNIFLIQK